MEFALGNEIQMEMSWSRLKQVSENKDYFEERHVISMTIYLNDLPINFRHCKGNAIDFLEDDLEY